MMLYYLIRDARFAPFTDADYCRFTLLLLDAALSMLLAE